jgi:hypothetical protein
MPEQSVIVWDLETVPDIAAAARLLDLEDAPEAQVREALGTGHHKIACVGALVASLALTLRGDGLTIRRWRERAACPSVISPSREPGCEDWRRIIRVRSKKRARD